jgi:hypothetical protein
MSEIDKCPICGGEAIRMEDEVDIGVGTLKHLVGWDCLKCGQVGPDDVMEIKELIKMEE